MNNKEPTVSLHEVPAHLYEIWQQLGEWRRASEFGFFNHGSLRALERLDLVESRIVTEGPYIIDTEYRRAQRPPTP